MRRAAVRTTDKVLLDSNLDWGQDLITLRDYMRRGNIDHVDLAYFGRVDPQIVRPSSTGQC